ncbi:MAG TPA: outer membrane lipoprotein carrier protein LolA [Flavipsychrobacter sp.]|nr:outer membrane lipoprotein carrier protein LolA [Flavipsychrobacter sp.]
MKKLFIACVTIACCATYSVQAQNDAKAKNILEAVSKKINGLKSLKANFALHLSSANGKANNTKKGTFFMKGPKYRVELSGQEIICDNKTVWTYTKDAKEVQVSSYNPNEQTISPSKLFTNFYDKEYKYSYVGEKKVNGKTVDVIDLVPTNGGKQFNKVELMVDKASNTITGGSIWEKNGNKYQYEISNFTPNTNIPDASFTFDTKAHPGVEVVDLR